MNTFIWKLIYGNFFFSFIFISLFLMLFILFLVFASNVVLKFVFCIYIVSLLSNFTIENYGRELENAPFGNNIPSPTFEWKIRGLLPITSETENEEVKGKEKQRVREAEKQLWLGKERSGAIESWRERHSAAEKQHLAKREKVSRNHELDHAHTILSWKMENSYGEIGSLYRQREIIGKIEIKKYFNFLPWKFKIPIFFPPFVLITDEFGDAHSTCSCLLCR